MQAAWILISSVLLLSSAYVFSHPISLRETGCQDGQQEGCTRQTGCTTTDGRVLSKEDVLHRLTPKSQLTKSMDICFVISATHTMTQAWIQTLVTLLDQRLQDRGVGGKEGEKNRFCIVQFGARGSGIKARLLKTDDDHYFMSSDNISSTYKNLRNDGYIADGYEALQFVLSNVPFRDSPSVKKSVVMATDSGRTILADKVGLTSSVMEQLIGEAGISLDVLVNITLSHLKNNEPMGILDYASAVVQDENASYQIVPGRVNILSSHGNTLEAYVNLSLKTGGRAWTIQTVNDDNASHISSLVSAMIDNWGFLKNTECEECFCASDRNATKCAAAKNQRECRQCVNRTLSECYVTGKLAGLIYSDHQFVQVFTAVTQQPYSKDANISFHGNRGDMTFKCLHFNSSNITLKQCLSPFTLKGLANGLHLVLIVGKAPNDVETANLVEFQVNYGPVKIFVSDKKSADIYGVVTINFELSRNDATCSCAVNLQDIYKCDEHIYRADPKKLGAGDHTLTISCTDSEGWNTQASVNIVLNPPPLIPSSPLSCSLSIIQSNTYTVAVNFSCNRAVNTTCTIANLPAHSCTNPYTFNASSLSPGNHPFTLYATDLFGYTSTNIVTFSVKAPKRLCCPLIIKDQTVLSANNLTFSATLRVNVNFGNCSIGEGFSYHLDWGDSSSVQGSTPTHHTLYLFTRVYANSGHYPVSFKYCNNPSSPCNLCCDQISLSLFLSHPSS